MNIESLDGSVMVSLSRRNLMQLLAALDQEIPTALNRMTKKGHLVVIAQEDDVHYDLREEGPAGPGLERLLS